MPVVLALAAGSLAAQVRHVSDAEVLEVHEAAILVDGHNDVTSNTVDGMDIGPRRNEEHTDLVRLREGGFGAVFFAAYVSPSYVEGNHSAHRVLEMIDTIRHDIVERYPDDFTLALTADDVVRAHDEGKIAALIGIEGGHAIEDSLRLLRDYYALGARYMTLTHSNTNNWADSAGGVGVYGENRHGGLTDLGRDVVREMNRIGMMVDVSHVSDDTFWDVMEVSTAPVIASHSSCRALTNIPRNMTDEMIQAMAEKGGVIAIGLGCGFVNKASADTSRWFNPAIYDRTDIEIVPATLDQVIDHIDHAVDIAGIDAVGLGSDFEGVECTPIGLEDASKMPNLTRALLEHGYVREDVLKILGGNMLRVMREVERVAEN